MTQPWLFIVFLLVILSLFGMMQYRLFRLFRRWAHRAFHESRCERVLQVGRTVLLVMNVVLFLQFLIRATSVYDHPVTQVLLVYPSGFFFAGVVFSFLFVSLGDIIRMGIRLGLKVFHHSVPAETGIPRLDEGRRRFIRGTGLSAAATVGSLPILASFLTARDYQLNRKELKFDELPAELDGLTIVQVSDIHSGVYMTEENMNEIFSLVQRLHPDIIMITGDFVDSSDSQIEPLANALKLLRADIGIYGCLGNHDHFATASKVTVAAENLGIRMLNNLHQELLIHNKALTVAGIDDAGRGSANFADLEKALVGSNPESFRIVLTHRPDMWDTTLERGVHLTLAGHTHGGQVGFRLGPVNLNPVHLVHKYAMGLYEDRGRYLYVNVGVGMVGVPIRMVKPEIAAITLRSS